MNTSSPRSNGDKSHIKREIPLPGFFISQIDVATKLVFQCCQITKRFYWQFLDLSLLVPGDAVAARHVSPDVIRLLVVLRTHRAHVPVRGPGAVSLGDVDLEAFFRFLHFLTNRTLFRYAPWSRGPVRCVIKLYTKLTQ